MDFFELMKIFILNAVYHFELSYVIWDNAKIFNRTNSITFSDSGRVFYLCDFTEMMVHLKPRFRIPIQIHQRFTSNLVCNINLITTWIESSRIEPFLWNELGDFLMLYLQLKKNCKRKILKKFIFLLFIYEFFNVKKHDKKKLFNFLNDHIHINTVSKFNHNNF